MPRRSSSSIKPKVQEEEENATISTVLMEAQKGLIAVTAALRISDNQEKAAILVVVLLCPRERERQLIHFPPMQKIYSKAPELHSNSIQVPLRDEGQAANQRTGRSQGRIVCLKKGIQKER